MKILFITTSPIDENNLTHPVSIRYNKYIEQLRKKGDVELLFVDLLSWSKNYKFLYRIINKLLSLFPNIIEILYKYKILKYIRKNNYDLFFITVVNMKLVSIPSFVRKIVHRCSIYVDMCDPITANMIFPGLSMKKKTKLSILEQNMMKDINLLILLNYELKQYYSKLFRNLDILVIEQGINENIIRISHSNKITDNIILLYAGILYKEYREAFELYNAINTLNGICKLELYGSFKKVLLPSSNSEYINCYPAQPISKLQVLYSNADMLVFIDNKSSLQVPGKTLELLATNKPILYIYYDINSPSSLFMKEFEGVFFAQNNSNSILLAIDAFSQNSILFYNRDMSKYYWDNIINRINYYL